VRLAIVLVACVACGRVNFDPRGGGDGGGDDSGDGPGSQAVAWAGTFVAAQTNGTNVTTFGGQAHAPGNVVVVHAACDGAASPTAVSLTAPGWTFTQIASIAGVSSKWGTAFTAIAPDTAPATFTVTWVTGSCSGNMNEVGDEFANADTTTPVDAVDMMGGGGDCQGMVTTTRAGDAIWAACSTGGTTTGTGPGYTKSGDDAHDDWSEYKLTTDPAGTVETATFVSASGGGHVMDVVAIRAR
jgi:hypothetical protein